MEMVGILEWSVVVYSSNNCISTRQGLPIVKPPKTSLLKPFTRSRICV